MTNYKQLRQEQRYVIGRLLDKGKNQSEIAQALGCHKSTVSRELKRNVPKRGVGALIYNPERAQIKTKNRHLKKNKRTHITKTMRHIIVNQLQVEKFSPELIAQYNRKDIPDFVSHETIYRWIWKMKHSHKREDKPYRLCTRN